MKKIYMAVAVILFGLIAYQIFRSNKLRNKLGNNNAITYALIKSYQSGGTHSSYIKYCFNDSLHNKEVCGDEYVSRYVINFISINNIDTILVVYLPELPSSNIPITTKKELLPYLQGKTLNSSLHNIYINLPEY